MKTADWYIPHSYNIHGNGYNFTVAEYNGAGQYVRTDGPFDSKPAAHAFVAEQKLNRAKHMGALIEETTMNRYHVHGTINTPIGRELDANWSITLDAKDDAEAQAIAMDLFSEPVDVTEIEEV